MRGVLLALLALLLAFVTARTNETSLLIPISTNAPSFFPNITHKFLPRYNPSKISFPFPTNKFNTYFLFSPTTVSPIIVHPFTVKLNKDFPYGLFISHNDEKIFGGGTPDRAEFYFNVVLLDVGFSSTQLQNGLVTHEVESLNNFGAEISLTQGGGRLVFPIVRGMAYVTAIYENMNPIIFTQHAVLTVNGKNPVGLVETNTKFKLELNNGQKWILYALTSITLRFDSNRLVCDQSYSGVLRLTQIPKGDNGASEQILDAHARRYVVRGELEVYPQHYVIRWETGGDAGQELLHYAHLHHLQVLSGATQTGLVLPSTTKGPMRGVVGQVWRLDESVFSNVTFTPNNPPDPDKLPAIIAQLEIDVDADFLRETFLDSNYFSGKALQKFALVCLVAQYVNRVDLRDKCVNKLIEAITPFVKNQNKNPFVYDQSWGGIIAQGGIIGEPLVDFGNSYYNDHHYHFGYLIGASAILGHLRPDWAVTNAEWVNNLIRDVNNPSPRDPYFVTFRTFDWWSGHSWAQGIFESGDAKDQESTSEEINYHYAVKLWALVNGNDNLYKLADLMLAVNIRSINTYFLMDRNNQAHPPQFIGNKVTGIFFENKVHYTTWFSPRTECIHGIQMIPMTLVSQDVRPKVFVQEEWELLKDIAPIINDGWASLLYSNYALLNKNEAFAKLQTVALDDGLTRTWALFWAATRP